MGVGSEGDVVIALLPADLFRWGSDGCLDTCRLNSGLKEKLPLNTLVGDVTC